MSAGVIDRMRHRARVAPNTLVSVYPGDVIEAIDALQARAEAAVAEAAKWREMHDDRDHDLQNEYARANALEAENALLREAAQVFYDTFHVDDEGFGFVYWTTKPKHVEAFERAFGIGQDAA